MNEDKDIFVMVQKREAELRAEGAMKERKRILIEVNELSQWIDGVSNYETGEMLFVKDLLEYIGEVE